MTNRKNNLAATLAGLLACATALAPLPTLAQQAGTATTFEATVFAGWQSSLDFNDQASASTVELESADSAGLIVDINLAPDIQLEFLYSRANSALSGTAGARLGDVKVEYLHAGAAYVYSDGPLRPFFVATGGATRLDSSTGASDTRFSLGLGGGVKYFITRNIGLRVEARAYATQVDSDSAAFCRGGTCRVYYDGDFLMQYTAGIGLAVAF